MSTTTRIKAPAFRSRLEFERAIDELAQETVALRKAESIRDAKLQNVRESFEPLVAVHSDRIKLLALSVEKYAEEHRDELLPGKLKSAETPLAFFGFRLGQPTLKLLSRVWTWEKVVLAIKERWQDHTVYIRTREEADKDALKRREPGELAEVGLRVDQSETFFVEPKEMPTALEATG